MTTEMEERATPETLRALYATTCSEITRYRDREWKNVTLFTAAIVGVIGFVLAKSEIARSHWWLCDLTLVLLAAANIS